MNRKTLTILIALAVALIGGIAVAVVKLYSPQDKSENVPADPEEILQRHGLLKAIPSDAAIVFCFKNFSRACEVLGDSLTVFGELASDRLGRIADLKPGSLKRVPAILSVHYSKDLPPLLVLEAGKAIADSSADLSHLMAEADSAGLVTKIHEDLVLVSTSETIVNSSIRHMEEGHNILEAKGFPEIASAMPGDDVVFFSNAYADNVLGAFLADRLRKAQRFIKGLGEWTAFTLEESDGGNVRMKGRILYDNNPSYYLNSLTGSGAGSSEIAEALPGETVFVIDLPIGGIKAYIKAHRDFLDSKASLDKYETLLRSQKKDFGLDAEQWAQRLDIKEIAEADIRIGDKIRPLLLIRPGKKAAGEAVCPAGFPSTLFGEAFKAEDESACAQVGGWIAAGSADAVQAYSEKDFLQETLAARLKAERLEMPGDEKNRHALVYHSLSEEPNLIDSNFKPLMAKGVRRVLNGAVFVPAMLGVDADERGVTLGLRVDRIEVSGNLSAAQASRDTTVNVPQGPFKVQNSATGQTNTLYQNSHLSICLKDETGKDLWGVPFKSKICGYVQNIDYYNNGKIQFLFAAGSQLYLIDRLGRFVSGFPAETGKQITAGPAVYDFTGAKGYTAMVLHKDNTVGYYDLHGKKVASWQGITAGETIKSLPELLEGGGKKYWVVRTSAQALVFPFDGGEPIVKGEGERMIRPDSEIKITDKGFEAVCHDGKERTFKPGK